MNDHSEQHGPIGNSRESAMLSDLLDYMDQVHARRRIRRRVVTSAATMAVVALMLTTIMRPSPKTAPAPAAIQSKSQSALPERSPTAGWKMATRAGIAAEYAIPPTTRIAAIERVENTPRFVKYLDDAELVRTLAEAGRPTGLIRMGHRVMLTQAVTDEELAPEEPSSSS